MFSSYYENYHKNKNTEKIVLTPDENSVLNTKLNEICHLSSFLIELLSKEELTYDFKGVSIGLLEAYLKEVQTILNYEEDLDKNKELKQNLLREANIKIRDLESTIANNLKGQFSFSDIYQLLEKTQNNISQKWGNPETGLGGLVNIEFNSYLVHITFTPMLTCYSFGRNETPVSNKAKRKEWIESLRKDKGLVIVEDNLILTERNVEYLEELMD